MSASSKTMTGALPPSSRCVRLTVLRGGLEHLLAGGDVAGERDHRDLRVVDQRAADALAAADHDVDARPPGRSRRAICASFSAVSGVCSDGLRTTVLPPASAGAELPGRHHQRIVPRRDRGDDADRIAADHRGVAGQVFAAPTMPGMRAHRAGEEAEAVDDRRDLVVAARA